MLAAWQRSPLGTLSLATVPGSGKLVFVLLRGGLDGLSAVVPYGDRDYQKIRGDLAFKKADLEVLNDQFGLAPGFHPLKQLWDEGELALVHAMAIPYRTRSHFDGQAILETGLDAPRGSSDGWLNRLLQVMEGNRSGIAVAAGLPLILIRSPRCENLVARQPGGCGRWLCGSAACSLPARSQTP